MADNPQVDAVHLLGNILTFKLLPQQTGNSFCVTECKSAPGAGAPANSHAEDEAFLVLEGSMEFIVDGQSAIHGPGSLVRIPNGAVHAFRNAGNAPSRMLILNWPGTDHEAFFRAVGEPVSSDGEFPQDGPPPDTSRLARLAASHGVIFAPPA